VSGLGDLALLGAIKAFARGKRWHVRCAVCGGTIVATDVTALGKGLLAHTHDGEVDLTIQSGARIGT
jgi:hypothetical protein